MAVLGRRHAGKDASYDPSSGHPYRISVTFPAHLAPRVVAAARLTNLSVSGLIVELAKRMPLDEEGRPMWADELLDLAQLPLDRTEVAS